MKNELVYGQHEDNLVFVPRGVANELIVVRDALDTSTTWGEFRSRLPTAYREEVAENFRDAEETPPDDDQPFNADDVPGVADGDWPTWPARAMLSWAPQEIQQQFGKEEYSMVGDIWLQLDATQADAIVAAFEAHGYTCTRDDELVLRASGA